MKTLLTNVLLRVTSIGNAKSKVELLRVKMKYLKESNGNSKWNMKMLRLKWTLF